jgi:hypothetical protein
MSGHTITPYEIYATRIRARDEKKKQQRLLLASLSDETSIDLLDVVVANVRDVDPVVSNDSTKTTSCLMAERRRGSDRVTMVFASDYKGAREVLHDGEDASLPVVYEKRPRDVTRYYWLALLWRPPTGDTGALLVHSPWTRGGSKGHVLTFLQRAVSKVPETKAKLKANPMIPQAVLQRIMRDAKTTRISYVKTTGVTSEFDRASGKRSAPAEMDLVIKGSGSIPYRDALAAALRQAENRDKFFTVEVRGTDGKFHEETFDDVEISVQTGSGLRTYSVRNETFPTLGFNRTPEINSVYWNLPAGDYAKWPGALIKGTRREFDDILHDVAKDLSGTL